MANMDTPPLLKVHNFFGYLVFGNNLQKMTKGHMEKMVTWVNPIQVVLNNNKTIEHLALLSLYAL